MRSTRENTSQTTCDGVITPPGRFGNGYCPEYVMTAFFKRPSPEQLAARHLANVTEEGWADVEGRDYCPAHIPDGVRPTP